MTVIYEIDCITETTVSERKKIFHWVASLSEESILVIFQEAVKKSFQIKAALPTLPGKVCKYSAFILASRSFGWDTLKGKGYRVADVKQFDDFSNLRKANVAEFMARGRNPILKRKILAYWGEIKELRAEGAGFRKISSYLSKSRKIKASASYLSILWKEIEKP